MAETHNTGTPYELIIDRLDSIEGKVDRLDESIRGNGKPGLNQTVHDVVQDVDHLKTERDRFNRNARKVMWGAVGAVAATVATLAATGAWTYFFGG